MLDAEARTLLDLMDKAVQDGRPKLHTLPYAVGRKAVDKMSEDSEAEPLAVGEIDDGAFAGPGGEIRFRHYTPFNAAEGPLPTLIYYHGGGFVIGNIETHDSTCRRLSNKSHCQVISIDYRLSPVARASLPGADRGRRGGVPPYPRQRRRLQRRC